MWHIIKAEYLHTQISIKNALPLYFTLAALLFIFLGEVDLAIVYLFGAGTVLAFHDDNRFYLYQKLPVLNKKIAKARLIMIGINTIALLAIVTPTIIYFGTDTNGILLKLFAFIGILLLARILSFSLSDITTGFYRHKSKKLLALMLAVVTPVVIAFMSIMTIYFKRPIELKIMFIALSFSLIPIFAYISIRTFIAKERILVKGK